HSPSSAGLPFPDGNWFAQPTWQTTTKTSPHARIVPSLSERDSSKPGTRTQVRARSHAPRPRRDKIVAPLRRLELRPRKTAARREGVVEGGDGAVVGQLRAHCAPRRQIRIHPVNRFRREQLAALRPVQTGAVQRI